MKLITILLLLSTSVFASGNRSVNLDFWDGTFAYNILNLSAEDGSHLYKIKMHGSTLGLGKMIEGKERFWGKDEVEFHIRRDQCGLNMKTKTFSCVSQERLSMVLTWQAESGITKSYRIVGHNVKVQAAKTAASLKFDIAPTDDFNSATENIVLSIVGFGDLDIHDRHLQDLALELRIAVSEDCQVSSASKIVITNIKELTSKRVTFSWKDLETQKESNLAVAKEKSARQGRIKYLKVVHCGSLELSIL